MTPLVRAGFLLSFLLAAAPAPAAEVKDLSGQFPDEACRSQGKVGACHSFASIALLEAAIFRRHGAVGKDASKLALSEGDLFVRRTLASPDYLSRVVKHLDATNDIAKAVHSAEGGSSQQDVSFALENGIAAAGTVSFDLVAKRYAAYREGVEKTLAEKFEACGLPAVPGAYGVAVKIAPNVLEWTETALAQIDRDLASLGGPGTPASPRVEQLQRAQVRCEGLRQQAQAVLSFSNYLEQAAGQDAKTAELFLLGDIPGLEQERAWVRGLLKDFAQDHRVYGAVASGIRDKPRSCRAMGGKQRAFLLARLRQGIPVGVSMDLGGLEQWKSSGASATLHAFVVSGYTLSEDELALKTRNSWSGLNPDVTESELCRIRDAVALLSDKEE